MNQFTPQRQSGAIVIELSTRCPRYSGFRRLFNKEMLQKDSAFVAARQNVIKSYQAAGYIDYTVLPTDIYDLESVHFVSRNTNGGVNGTLRICKDSKHGLPAAEFAPKTHEMLKRRDREVSEAGRFTANGLAACKQIVSAAFQFGQLMKVDFWLQVRKEHAPFYIRHCGAEPIGGRAPAGCKNLIWQINNTPTDFYTTFGNNQTELSVCWQNEELVNEAI